MGEPIAEVGYLAGLCGHNATSWEKVLIDASKRLVVAIAAFTAAVEVTQDTPGDLLIGSHGHIGGAWQKQPLIWGISDSVAEVITDENLGAGSQSKATTAIVAGEVHVVSTIAYRIDSGTCTRSDLNLVVDGTIILVQQKLPPVSGTWYLHTGEFVLAKDDYVYVSMVDLTAGDNLYLRYAAYRMDIDL